MASLLFAAFVGFASAGEPAPAPPAPPPPAVTTFDYVLDPAKGDLYVQADKDPSSLASSLAHDHVIQATAWRGTVHWDTANVAACRIDVTVPVGNLRNDDPTIRQRLGYTTQPDPDTRDKTRLNMQDTSQLYLEKYPEIKYVSTKCVPAGDRVNVTGTLTIRGVGVSVTVPMKVAATASEISASGKFTVNTTDFGFQPFQAFGGLVKVLNPLRFTIDVKGHAK